MLEFVLFCIPTLIYVLAVSRKPDETIRSTFARAGGSWGSASGYGWALALLLPLLLAAWLAIVLIPAEVLTAPGVQVARLTSAGAILGVILRAVGEEVFFRGASSAA